MNKKATSKYRIFNIIFASILGFSISLAMVTSYEFSYDSMIIFMITLFINIFLFIVFYNKTSKIISLVSSLIIIITFLIYTLYNHELSSYFKNFISLFDWIIDYYRGIASENILFEKIFINIIYILISIFIFIFAVKSFKLFILLPVVSIIYVIQWQLGYFQSKTAFLLSMFMSILFYFKYIFLKYYKIKADNKKIFIFSSSMIPLSALIISIVLLIPKSDSPIIWEWLDNIYRNINEYFKNDLIIDNDFFSFSQTGFGSGGALGGRVSLDDTLVLRVNSDERIYLRGAILDEYTGRRWIKSSDVNIPYMHDTSFSNNDLNNSSATNDSFEYNEARFDLNMMLYGIKYLFAPIQVINDNGDKAIVFNDLNENTTLDIASSLTEIIYENIKTKTIFHPLKTDKFLFDSYSENINIDSNSGIYTDTSFKNGSSYSVKHYSLAIEDSINILRKTQLDYYKNILEYNIENSNYSSRRAFNILFNYNQISYLNSFSESQYEKYLQLPDELPQRVKDFALDITIGYENLLDKVKAVEKHLSSNYPYTLDTDNLPKDRDFVDYFLFDENKGYCTYYASSMVVLLRSIGIPARYVEGYILPANKDSDGYYYVTNKNAHAWPEVYLDGYGWVTFEPTASFNAVYYNDQSSSGTVDASFLENPYYLEYLLGLEEYNAFNLEGFEGIPTGTSGKTSSSKIILFIIFIFIALLLGVILFNSIKIKYKVFKRISYVPRKAILELYTYIINLYRLWEYPPKTAETALAFSNRVSDLVFDSKIDFKKVTLTYLEARYSENEISITNKDIFVDYIGILMKNIKYSFGKPKYFLYKYIVGKF